jgi:hypothetical protein
VATRNLALGEPLLVCCRPLVALLGEQGRPPSNEELVDALLAAQLEPDQAAWLRLLYRGTEPEAGAAAADGEAAGDGEGEGEASAAASGAGSTAGSRTAASDLADLEEAAALLSRSCSNDSTSTSSSSSTGEAGRSSEAGHETAASSNGVTTSHAPSSSSTGNGNGSGAALSVLGVPCPLTREQAARVVAQTAFAEQSEDGCAAALKELSPESVAGVWQEFGLLNHSCAPNTCMALFGTALVVSGRGPFYSTGRSLTPATLLH